MAIEQALNILSWHENVQKEDIPPEYLWEDEQGLDMWWKSVEDKHKDGTTTSRGHADPANDDQPPGMAENDHARFIRDAYT